MDVVLSGGTWRSRGFRAGWLTLLSNLRLVVSMVKFSPSTKLLSVLLPLAFLLPALVVGFVDDVRIDGFPEGADQVQVIVDWEPGVGTMLSSSNLDGGSPRLRNTTGTNDDTTLSGESMVGTAFYNGAGASVGAPRESIVFGAEVSRSAFLDAEPTKFTVNWSRDDVVDGDNDVSITWLVCPTADFCSSGTAVDTENFILLNNVWTAPNGSGFDVVELGDIVDITNLIAKPSGGSEWIAVAFLDDTIAEGTLVAMDATITGPVAKLAISLDTFADALNIYSFFLIILAIFAFDFVSVEGLTEARRRAN